MKKHRRQRENRGRFNVTSRAKIEQITRRNVSQARKERRENNGKAGRPRDGIGDQKTSKWQPAM